MGGVVRDTNYREEVMRNCSECKFDIDAISAIDCNEHKWHNETIDDMCCLCGLDAEMLMK